MTELNADSAGPEGGGQKYCLLIAESPSSVFAVTTAWKMWMLHRK